MLKGSVVPTLIQAGFKPERSRKVSVMLDSLVEIKNIERMMYFIRRLKTQGLGSKHNTSALSFLSQLASNLVFYDHPLDST